MSADPAPLLDPLQVLQASCKHWEAALQRSQDLLALTNSHGIEALLGSSLETAPLPEPWQRPPWQDAVSALVRTWHRERAREFFRRQELMQVLSQLQQQGLSVLLLKGTGLAYRYYSHPALRPRCDIDLLVAPGTQQRVIECLAALGYCRSTQEPQGERLSYQTSLYRQDPHGITHALDLHWRINNSQALANTLDYDSMWERAEPLRPLGEAAWIPCRTHLLLHAALHRAGHLRERNTIAGLEQRVGDRLLWLYDIHLLCADLSAEDWQDLCDEAIARGLAAVLVDALQRCRLSLGTMLPEAALNTLQSISGEPAAIYLRASPLQHLVADFRALDWRGRRQLAQEMLFPPVTQLRQQPSATESLPLFYLRRLWRGARKLIQGI